MKMKPATGANQTLLGLLTFFVEVSVGHLLIYSRDLYMLCPLGVRTFTGCMENDYSNYV